MTCHESRALVGADPNADTPELTAHIEQCPACARYREELQAMDRLIYQALKVDVAAAKADVAPPAAPRRRMWNRPAWSLAASLLLAVSLALTIWLLNPRETFAAQLVEHVKHEPYTLVGTSEFVDPGRLNKVMASAGLQLDPGAAHVSYAKSCWFRGHFVPHLAVQTERGPVNVIVLPQEAPRASREQIDESGFRGVIVPAPRGVIVVLGEGGIPVDTVANTVLDALEYEATDRPPG